MISSLLIALLYFIMTSPCNGKACCFYAHPRVFRFWWKIFTCLDELPWVHYEYLPVCRQVKWTLTQEVSDLFLSFIHISIRRVWSPNLSRENFKFKKNVDQKPEFKNKLQFKSSRPFENVHWTNLEIPCLFSMYVLGPICLPVQCMPSIKIVWHKLYFE